MNSPNLNAHLPGLAGFIEGLVKEYRQGKLNPWQDLAPLLRVIMLADNEGWTMFCADKRQEQRSETLRAFEKVKRLVYGPPLFQRL